MHHFYCQNTSVQPRIAHQLSRVSVLSFVGHSSQLESKAASIWKAYWTYKEHICWLVLCAVQLLVILQDNRILFFLFWFSFHHFLSWGRKCLCSSFLFPFLKLVTYFRCIGKTNETESANPCDVCKLGQVHFDSLGNHLLIFFPSRNVGFYNQFITRKTPTLQRRIFLVKRLIIRKIQQCSTKDIKSSRCASSTVIFFGSNFPSN